jgi:hypothetical protein
MIIAKRTAPGVYEEINAGSNIYKQVDVNFTIIDSTIAGPELHNIPREVMIWDTALVDGVPVRTERSVIAIDKRPVNTEIVFMERLVPATDVLSYAWAAIIAMSDEELADLSLYRAVETPVPEGKISVGWTLQDVDGVCTQVHQLEDIPPPPVPQTLSFRQLVLGLLQEEKTADAQALASRTIPPSFQSIIDQMTEQEKVVVQVTILTMTEADRSSSLIGLASLVYEWDDEKIDDFFRTYSQV